MNATATVEERPFRGPRKQPRSGRGFSPGGRSWDAGAEVERVRKVTKFKDAPAVRLSRDKVNKLAHVVTDAVADMPGVDFLRTAISSALKCARSSKNS